MVFLWFSYGFPMVSHGKMLTFTRPGTAHDPAFRIFQVLTSTSATVRVRRPCTSRSHRWAAHGHGSLNVPIFHITQPLGIWSIMATIRWCPIFPKWDIYQSLMGLKRHRCDLDAGNHVETIGFCIKKKWKDGDWTNIYMVSYRNIR